MRLDYFELTDVKGKAVMVNPWQVVRLYGLTIGNEAGSRIVFPDGVHHDFLMDVDLLSVMLRRAAGQDV